jgi:transposase InsO family protein
VQVHPNAKTTPKGRAVLLHRVTELGWTMARAADASGVSTRTGFKWLARYRAEGRAGLEDRRSVPRRRPHRTPVRWERWIVGLRARRLSGPAIAHRTGIPRATVGHVLRRHGLGRLPPLQPKPPVRRYERAQPGELVHIDTKALGRIAMVGHRITGVRQHRTRGIGWEHVHVCIDDATRVAYVEVLPTNQQQDATAFLARAVAWFAARGVRIARVMSDNGSAYKARSFAATCAELGVRHVTTRPYTPRTNGKAERFIQTLLREWAYRAPYATSARRRRALTPWLRYYNHRRPHAALRDRAPMTRLQEASA